MKFEQEIDACMLPFVNRDFLSSKDMLLNDFDICMKAGE